ncbi:hypothetical protein JI435_308350, partial [Parastagonospora nodorum SN15]
NASGIMCGLTPPVCPWTIARRKSQHGMRSWLTSIRPNTWSKSWKHTLLSAFRIKKRTGTLREQSCVCYQKCSHSPVGILVESCVQLAEVDDNREIARHASKPSLWSDYKLLTIREEPHMLGIPLPRN